MFVAARFSKWFRSNTEAFHLSEASTEIVPIIFTFTSGGFWGLVTGTKIVQRKDARRRGGSDGIAHEPTEPQSLSSFGTHGPGQGSLAG